MYARICVKRNIGLSETHALLHKRIVSKKTLAIAVMIVLLGATFSQNSVMAQNEKVYCPESVEKTYCHKVIIIGAGIAGLGAAAELNSHKFNSHGYDDFVILETQNRIGGRISTNHTWANVPVDQHASWISGKYGNPITELAEKYNGTGYNSTGHIILKKTDDNNSVYYGNSTVDAAYTLWSEDFTNYYKHIRDIRMQNKSSDESLQVVINQFINDKKLNDAQKKDFLFEASDWLGNEYGSDPSDLSLYYWDKIGYVMPLPNGNPSDQVVFPNGYDQITDGLVADIGKYRILTSITVQEVDYDSQGVTVKTDNGNFYGKYMISTLPLNVLKNNNVKFVPDLPESKIEAIHKAKMGVLDKTYFIFPKLFWTKDKDIDWLNYIPPLNETGHWIAFLNLYKVNEQNMLLAFNYGDYANNTLEKMPGGEEAIKMEGLKVLDKMYPGQVLPLANQTQVLHRYDAKRGGSYSSIPIGFVVPDDFNELAKSLTDNYGVNRVFFAGEATTWHYPGLTNGAYVTGIREANRLMLTDNGTLNETPAPYWQEKNLRYPRQYNSSQQWQEFPEYIICKPNLIVVLKNDMEKTPICVKPDTAKALFDRNFIVDPSSP